MLHEYVATLVHIGDYDAAIKVCQHVLECDGMDIELLHYKALALLRLLKLDAALPLVHRALAIIQAADAVDKAILTRGEGQEVEEEEEQEEEEPTGSSRGDEFMFEDRCIKKTDSVHKQLFDAKSREQMKVGNRKHNIID